MGPLAQFAVAAGCMAIALAIPDHTASAQVLSTHLPSFDDMQRLSTIEELDVSPDGRWAAYVSSAPFGSDSSEPGRITLLDLRRHHARVVSIPGRASQLQWAGRSSNTLDFLLSTSGRKRVWRYSLLHPNTPPAPLAISDSLDGEIVAFTSNPEGTTIAYVAAEREAPGGSAGDPNAAPRLVLFNDSPGDYTGPTSPFYSRDSVGGYVAVVDVQGSARVLARHLVSAKYGTSIAWSSRGKLLVNGPAFRVSWLRQITSGLLYTVDPSTGSVHRVGSATLARQRAVWSPSGQRIADLLLEFLPDGETLPLRYTLRVEAPAQPTTALSLDGETDGLTSVLPPRWGGNDRTIYIARYQRGAARLFTVDLPTGQWRPITPDTLSVSRYSVSENGSVLIAVLENANQPQDVFQIDPATRDLTRLTRNVEHLPPMRLGHVDQTSWRSSDGRFTIHGFLVKPPNYDPERRYPLIVILHGGPGALFINSFVGVNFAPFKLPPQLLASAGYMVLLPNPRGDPSYGDEFAEAIHADWGPGPFSDVNAGIDTLIALGMVDSTAVGISGASYGGYLSAYAITQSDRFAAASIDDGPTDLVSEYGQNYATHSDLMKFTFDGPPWSQRRRYVSQSPITYVCSVRTPVLMRYGGRSNTDDDVRQSYMLAQGFEFYAGLRDAGVPVQFVLHPDQGHGIVDRGLYRDWVTRNIAWFDYWMLHRGGNPLAPTP
jgi:dipeptidyl aminopeptidase/acylaminoacyl peptidase